jgi:hypothetical protein
MTLALKLLAPPLSLRTTPCQRPYLLGLNWLPYAPQPRQTGQQGCAALLRLWWGPHA